MKKEGVLSGSAKDRKKVHPRLGETWVLGSAGEQAFWWGKKRKLTDKGRKTDAQLLETSMSS